MEASHRQTFREEMGRMEALIQAMEQAPSPAAQAASRELVQALLGVHGAALHRMLEIIYEAAGQPLIDDLGRDDVVSTLLLMHGLHPLSLEARVLAALDRVRPYLGSHGGDVELLGVTPEGAVRLRLEGSCRGCPSSQMTLQYAIEEAIYEAAPDVTAIHVEGAAAVQAPAAADGFIPIAALMEADVPAPRGGDGWIAVNGLAALGEGAVRLGEVAGRPVLFCRAGGTLYAYGSTCPHCRRALGQGPLEDRHLTCAACGHRYDVRQAGRDPEAPGRYLEPFPLLEEHGQALVALPRR